MVRILILGLLAVIASACARDVSGRSKVTLVAPQSSMSSSLATIPVGRTACYGVSIYGAMVDGGAANSCSPSVGITGGYVAGGQSLELSIPKGSGYTIDLYMYLKEVGDVTPCPTFSKIFSGVDLEHVYKVGSATGLNFSREEESVSITAVFPGVASTIAGDFSPSCLSTIVKGKFLNVNSSAGMATDGPIKVHASVGKPYEGQVLTGTGIKLKTTK